VLEYSLFCSPLARLFSSALFSFAEYLAECCEDEVEERPP
jgi:hypothetical protein